MFSASVSEGSARMDNFWVGQDRCGMLQIFVFQAMVLIVVSEKNL